MTATARKERKRRETRDELTRVARELIGAGGVAGLRVGDITDRMDIAAGSFYSHFESKDAVVEAVIAEAVSTIGDSVLRMSESLEDPAEAISVGIRYVVGLGYHDPELAHLLLELEAGPSLFERNVWPQALAVITAGAARGRVDTDDPALALTIATGSVMAVLGGVLSGRLGPDADVACAAWFLRGLGLSRAEAQAVAGRPLPSL